MNGYTFTLLHSEWPKLHRALAVFYGVLAVLSAIGLRKSNTAIFISAELLYWGHLLKETQKLLEKQLLSKEKSLFKQPLAAKNADN